MSKGLILDIKRTSVKDGPGIRTTVFLKGCPLRCIWCHNPESQQAFPELCFAREKCFSCGKCQEICQQDCHKWEAKTHIFHREKCIKCGLCVNECYSSALELAGKYMTLEEVMKEVMEDEIFYRKSGGGITVSGGEPLMQFSFSHQILQEAKKNQIHTAIETCGFAPWQNLSKLLPVTDLFLFDYKATDPEKHKRFTGVENSLILENLSRLSHAGAEIILTCPLVPGLNDDNEHLDRIAVLAESLPGIKEIALHPFHPMGREKALQLGYCPPPLPEVFTDPEKVRSWKERIRRGTGKKII